MRPVINTNADSLVHSSDFEFALAAVPADANTCLTVCTGLPPQVTALEGVLAV